MTGPDGPAGQESHAPALSAHPVGRLDSVQLLDFVVRRLAVDGQHWIATLIIDDENVVVSSTDPELGLPGTVVAASAPAATVVVTAEAGGVTVTVPLAGADCTFGHLVGRLRDVDDVAAARRAHDLGVLGSVLAATIARDADRDRLQRRVEDEKEAALLDVLTGLGNRRGWRRARQREEARARRSNDDAVVVVCDLDGLKEINDSEGHAAGDALIARTARALSTTLRTSDEAFRVGGDEFVVLLTDIGALDLDHVLARVRTALDDAGVAASLGAASRSGQGTLARAFEEADERMYDDKRRRTGRPGR